MNASLNEPFSNNKYQFVHKKKTKMTKTVLQIGG
jgi:hypothetical protein